MTLKEQYELNKKNESLFLMEEKKKHVEERSNKIAEVLNRPETQEKIKIELLKAGRTCIDVGLGCMCEDGFCSGDKGSLEKAKEKLVKWYSDNQIKLSTGIKGIYADFE